jgi:hypothetical protein
LPGPGAGGDPEDAANDQNDDAKGYRGRLADLQKSFHAFFSSCFT